MKLNNANCGTTPLTVLEGAVLIVIIVVAGALAAAGWPIFSVVILILEALSLGRRVLVRLRRGRSVMTWPAQA
ncbi:hypothetical protein [Streptomyces sp. NPDC018584]|uniref:hypothetical protein n=1 Tax=unclassified Streptomyces TaxID=2593676 RepID=UPI0037978819